MSALRLTRFGASFISLLRADATLVALLADNDELNIAIEAEDQDFDVTPSVGVIITNTTRLVPDNDYVHRTFITCVCRAVDPAVAENMAGQIEENLKQGNKNTVPARQYFKKYDDSVTNKVMMMSIKTTGHQNPVSLIGPKPDVHAVDVPVSVVWRETDD